MSMPDSQRYPLQICLIKHKLEIHFFIFHLQLWFSCKCDWVMSCLLETMKKLSELTTFRFRIFDQIKVSIVPLHCLFCLKVELYAYSSFNCSYFSFYFNDYLQKKEFLISYFRVQLYLKLQSWGYR